MSDAQYTIRAVPKKLDKFLRRKSLQTGKSLNRVVLDYLERGSNFDLKAEDSDLSWFIGSGSMDEASLDAIEELNKADKQKQKREMRSWYLGL